MKRVVILIAVAACGGGGPDLTGTYRVDVHTADATGCATQVPVTDPAYIRFSKEELLGHDYFSLSGCTDPAQADCPSVGLYGLYAEPITDGWRAELGFAQPTGGCILDYTWSEVVMADDTHIVLDANRYHDESDRPDSECTGQMAIDLGDSLPCASAEHIEATLL